MNEYYAMVSYHPLTLDQIKHLHNLGAIAPYDQANVKHNIYFYVPTEIYLELKPKLEAITPFMPIETPIPLEQIQKQLNKIEEVNRVQVGDIVYCRGFKKLPFTVNNVGETVHIHHILKRSNIVLEVSPKEVYPAQDDEIPTYTRRTYDEPTEVIYLDCDIYRETNKTLLTQLILRDLISIKLTYPDRKIILLNPIIPDDDIINMLPITQQHLPIGQVKGDIVTNTHIKTEFKLYRIQDNVLQPLIYSDKDKFISLFRSNRKTYNKALETWNRHLNKDQQNTNIVTETLKAEFKGTQTEPTIINTKETSISEIENCMLRHGMQNIHAKAEDIVYLLKGRL